eukprot:1842213-Prymnesium_polylepis.1
MAVDACHASTPVAAAAKRQPKEKKINWLAVTFGAQVLLFGTFIIAFFTVEQSRTSEMHDMQSELHRLRRENFRTSKKLMQYNKRVLEKEQEIEDDIRGRAEDDLPPADEGEGGAPADNA